MNHSFRIRRKMAKNTLERDIWDSTVSKCRDHRGWGVSLVSLPSLRLSCNISPHYCKCPLTTPAISPYLSLCTHWYSKFDICLLAKGSRDTVASATLLSDESLDGLKSMRDVQKKQNKPREFGPFFPKVFLRRKRKYLSSKSCRFWWNVAFDIVRVQPDCLSSILF